MLKDIGEDGKIPIKYFVLDCTTPTRQKAEKMCGVFEETKLSKSII